MVFTLMTRPCINRQASFARNIPLNKSVLHPLWILQQPIRTKQEQNTKKVSPTHRPSSTPQHATISRSQKSVLQFFAYVENIQNDAVLSCTRHIQSFRICTKIPTIQFWLQQSRFPVLFADFPAWSANPMQFWPCCLLSSAVRHVSKSTSTMVFSPSLPLPW